MLRTAVEDEHSRVRLEAIRACSYFHESEAAEVALLALNHEVDYYVDFTLRHTIRRLEPVWKEAVGSGKNLLQVMPKPSNTSLIGWPRQISST